MGDTSKDNDASNETLEVCALFFRFGLLGIYAAAGYPNFQCTCLNVYNFEGQMYVTSSSKTLEGGGRGWQPSAPHQELLSLQDESAETYACTLQGTAKDFQEQV